MPRIEPAQTRQSYDIVIIGGGLVGASLACSIQHLRRRFGLRVALVESFIPQKLGGTVASPSFDTRSTALSFGSRQIYESWDLWTLISAAATPIEQIHISDKGHFGSTRINARELGVDALGYVVENAVLGAVLYDALRAEAAVEMLMPASIEHISPISDGYRLVMTCEDTQIDIGARLVIIADGGRSNLCEQLQIKQQHTPYHQHAIIANVSTSEAHQNVAYERFTPEGPVALLPLREPTSNPQTRLALVYTVSEDRVPEVMALEDTDFLSALQARFGYRLGQFVRVGERVSFPLSLQRAQEQVRPGLVVVGNAAHQLHPIAGQGFNLAFRGVKRLADRLEQALEAKEPWWSLATLETYLHDRSEDQEATITFTDQTVRLFGNNDLLLGITRDLGLITLDLLPGMKRRFAKQAMGLSRMLPL